ncbi:MAG: serine hydrolase [Pseudomonadota bacterium]
MRRIILAALLTASACGPIVDRSLKPDNGVPMPLGTLDSQRDAALSAFLDERGAAIDALHVVQDGEIVFSYGAVDAASNLASARKSVLSLLYGIAIERGLIDPKATLAALGIDESRTPLTDQERTATVRHLLQSRSGVYLPADAESGGAAERRPSRGVDAPGEAFNYNNWGFNVLGLIFEQETGLVIGEAFRRWIAEPTGMQDFHPSHIFFDDEGGASDYPAYRIFLSARDLARLGVLVAQEGRWQGQQIVPGAWIEESATAWSSVGPPLSAAPVDGYGLSWWLDLARGDIIASGWGGQILYVGRSDGLVVAMVNDTGNSAISHLWFRWFAAHASGQDMMRILSIVRHS